MSLVCVPAMCGNSLSCMTPTKNMRIRGVPSQEIDCLTDYLLVGRPTPTPTLTLDLPVMHESDTSTVIDQSMIHEDIQTVRGSLVCYSACENTRRLPDEYLRLNVGIRQGVFAGGMRFLGRVSMGFDALHDCELERQCLEIANFGTTLEDHRLAFPSRSVPALRAVALTIELVHVIERLHSVGIAHCRLNPKNIVSHDFHTGGGMSLMIPGGFVPNDTKCAFSDDMRRVHQVLMNMSPELYESCEHSINCRRFESLISPLSITSHIDYAAIVDALMLFAEEQLVAQYPIL
jgi:hypothetical protein